MSTRTRSSAVAAGVLLAALAAAPPAGADPAKCQEAYVKALAKLKKTQLQALQKCLDSENFRKKPGPCPDAQTNEKIQKAVAQAVAGIDACTMDDFTALGFPSTCAFETPVQGREAQCAALPVTSPAEVAACLVCWKQAELSEFIALLYASHALEVCGGDLGETSLVCSDLDCTSPLPDQHILSNAAGAGGGGECQSDIGKAGVKYVLDREKILEKCALAGGTRASCVAAQATKLGKVAAKLHSAIRGGPERCGPREPALNPEFCCRTTGTVNDCVPGVPDRTTCTQLGNTVKEDRSCDPTLKCKPVGGGKKITWWGSCPESDTCPGPTLATIDDVADCVNTSADAIVDELLCLQFRSGWPCPSAETTTTTSSSTSTSTSTSTSSTTSTTVGTVSGAFVDPVA